MIYFLYVLRRFWVKYRQKSSENRGYLSLDYIANHRYSLD